MTQFTKKTVLSLIFLASTMPTLCMEKRHIPVDDAFMIQAVLPFAINGKRKAQDNQLIWNNYDSKGCKYRVCKLGHTVTISYFSNADKTPAALKTKELACQKGQLGNTTVYVPDTPKKGISHYFLLLPMKRLSEMQATLAESEKEEEAKNEEIYV